MSARKVTAVNGKAVERSASFHAVRVFHRQELLVFLKAG